MKKKKSLAMIEALSNAYGISGFEDQVLAQIRKHSEGLGKFTEDCTRNLYLRPDGNKGSRPVLQLDAHSDEVGFMVHAIKPNGTLQFIPIGGWVANNVPAHLVQVQNAKGTYIRGVVASKPPHFMSDGEKKQSADISQMVIDIGASSAEEVKKTFKIQVGAPVVPETVFSYDQDHDLMLGKAFDCRLGCAAIIDTISELKECKLGVDIVGAFSAQEETGNRGATITANVVKPDIAIVFEGCPADDTFAEAYIIQTAIKKGPMLRHIDAGMITNPRYQRFALDIGKKIGVPVQEAVRTGGFTNGRAIHLANQGVPVIVIGLPVRYIHTHYGFAAYDDYERAVKLAVAIAKELNANVIKGF